MSRWRFIERWCDRNPGRRYPLLMLAILAGIGLCGAIAPPL